MEITFFKAFKSFETGRRVINTLIYYFVNKKNTWEKCELPSTIDSNLRESFVTKVRRLKFNLRLTANRHANF